MPKSYATRMLDQQLDEGRKLLAMVVEDRVALARAFQAKAAWSLRNRQLLYKVFDDNSGIAGYRGMGPISQRASLPLQVEHFRQELRTQLDCLQDVLERVRFA